MLDQVADGAKVYTDDHRGYHGLPNHQTVKHSVGEYGSGRQAVHVLDFVFEERPKNAGGVPMHDYGMKPLWVTRYVEVKGMDHPVGKLKRAMVEAMMGVKIEVVK